MTAIRSHEIGFSGSVVFSAGFEVSGPARPIWVVGEHVARHAGIAVPADALIVPTRPDQAMVAELAARAREIGADAVVAAGDGAVLDGAKLATRYAGHAPELILAPCGREPWRAFAPFAAVDDGPGARPSIVDAAFGTARVIVSDALLRSVDERLVAIGAVDTAVHAIESLLTARGQPYSDALATASLAIVAEELSGALTLRARARLVVAAGLAVEAFLATKLGLAHAFASPLGAVLGVTHDTLNGVLGRTVVRLSGDAPALAGVAAGLGVACRVPDVVARLDGFLARAELPHSLRELGIPWETVEQVLPRAARSSGVRAALEPIPLRTLRAFARAAWEGEPAAP